MRPSVAPLAPRIQKQGPGGTGCGPRRTRGTTESRVGGGLGASGPAKEVPPSLGAGSVPARSREGMEPAAYRLRASVPRDYYPEMNANALRALPLLAVALSAACTYQPAFELACDEEGAVDGARRCEQGVWVRLPGDADTDADVPGDTSLPDAGGCVAETDAEVCARLGLTCDPATVVDNCGAQRTVDCGTCTGAATCGGGGTPNVCACAAQSDVEFCAAHQKTCDPFTGLDACGEMRTVNCGTCAGLETCGADNTCTCDVASACAALSATCGMIDVTGQCAGTNSITCGTCDGPNAACDASNQCACEAGYEGDPASCADVDECATGTDDCDPNAACTNTPGSFDCVCNPGFTGNGRMCTPTDPLALSVQSVAVGMADGETSATGALGLPVVGANAVPFVTMRLQNTSDSGDDLALDVTVSDNEVQLSRESSTGDIDAQVYVVEFDPALASVQSGSFSFNNTSHTATLATTVDPAKSFVVFYYKRDNGSANFDDLVVAADLDSAGGAITFARAANAGTITGHYWVVEAVGSSFSVQHETAAFGSDATNVAISSVPSDKSLVLYSYATDHDTNDADAGQLRCNLTQTTAVQCRRYSGTDAITDLRVQVVTFAGVETVQRGVETMNGGTETRTVTLPTAVDATAMAFGGQLGFPGAVAHDATSGDDRPGGFFTQRVVNGATSVELRRGTPRPAAASVAWQVVDW